MKAQCIAAVSKVIGRDLSKAEADGIESRIRSNIRKMTVEDPAKVEAMSVSSRLDEAAKLAAEQIKTEAANAKRLAQLAVGAHDRFGGWMAQLKDSGFDPQASLERTLFDKADTRTTGVQPLELRIRATQEDYRRRLVNTMEALEPRLLGLLANERGVRAFDDEIFGHDTGIPIIKKAVEEWAKIMEGMRSHYVDAGGVLHPLEDWRYPQTHDQHKVFNAGAEKWIADVWPGMDRRKFASENGRLMTDDELRALLTEAWDTIATGGLNKIEPGVRPGQTMVAHRETAHRVLHFKDAESYRAYQAKYGGRDLWSILNGHIDRLSREIALMEHFGPNADHEFKFWNDTAMQDNRHGDVTAAARAVELDNAYRFLAGYTEGVAHPLVARLFDDARNIQSASKLGSAVLSSIPDMATLTMTAHFNRLSILGTYARGLKAMAGGAQGRRELERAGLMVNTSMQALRRYQVDNLGSSFSARWANAVISSSGLNRWTDGWRAGYAATQAHAIAHLTTTHETLDAMDPADAHILRAKGVTDVDYQVWRLAQPAATSFGKLLTADAIYRIPDDAFSAIKMSDVGNVAFSPMHLRREAARKLLGVTLSEAHMAVVEPGAEQRMTMGGATPRGTIKGELSRSFWQFKGYPWAFVQKHLVQRGWQGSEFSGGTLRYITPLVVLTTGLGALAMEIKDLVLGRDPRPLWGADSRIIARNWIAAFLQGGALGVYGDFLGSTATTDAKSALATAMGPVPGMVYEASNLALNNSLQALGNKPTHAGQEAVRFAKGMIPGGNLWYTKAATDHYIFNWLQDRLNPGHSARVEARARSEFGTTNWWSGASTTPERFPNVKRIVGK